MFKRRLQKIPQVPKARIVKFLIIFSVTGTSSIFVSDIAAAYIHQGLAYEMNAVQQLVLISIVYQFLLIFFCFIFGELGYVMQKFRKIKGLFQRSKT